MSKPDILDQAVSVDEADPYAKILVYGKNGAGKTRLAASAPNCLILDINERGTRSAKGSGAKVWSVSKWTDIGEVYWALKAGDHGYESVAIDTLTAMQNLAMRFVMGEAEERDPNRESGMPDKRTYGRAGELMKTQLLQYRNLPMHVVFTAQERVITDEDTGETVFHTADMPAGSRSTALGCVGIIGRLFTREVKIRNKQTKKVTTKWADHMLVGPSEEYDTKDRTGNLGRVVKDPTIPKIINAVKE